MKIIVLCLTLSISLCYPNNNYSQTTKISINIKNSTVKEVLSEIEKKTNYIFFYHDEVIDVNQKVNITAKNRSVSSILNDLFKNSKNTYLLSDRQIYILSDHTTQTISESNLSNQQTTEITGKVVNEKGEAIDGANVLLIGTNISTSTNNSGNFIIKGNINNAILKISYIGYKSKEVTIGNQTFLNVTLEADSDLDEIVVVGYGTMEKKLVTSSITSLKEKDLIKGLGGSTIASSLQGKVPGLTISGNSSPNSSPGFQLRGVASINASQSPLIVIDGIPGGDIRSLIIEDIQSIDVLKDASAGAIYGTRAAGGVILITTKRGQEGVLSLSLTNESSKQGINRRPQVLSKERFLKYGLGSDFGHETDWYDELLNPKEFSQRNVFTISGGGPTSKIYSSFMVQNQDGIVIGDSRKDYLGRINGDFSFLDNKLEIKARTEYRQAKRDQRFSTSYFNQALKLNPTISPYDPTSDTGYNVWTGGFDEFNPIADVNLRQKGGIDKWLQADVTGIINFTKDLSLQSTIGVQDRQWQATEYVSAFHKESLDRTRDGQAYHGFDKTIDISYEGQINYKKNISKHNMQSVLGYSFWERNAERFNMTNYDFTVDGVGPWNIGEGKFLSEGAANMYSYKNPRERLIAFFGRINYDFDKKYMISASLRHEGSSKFGYKNKWGDFYAISAGWRISNEKFMRNIEQINDLKIRVGYGVTGNNGFSAGTSTRMYTSNSTWYYNGDWIVSYGSAHNVNNELQWEEKGEINLGLDYSLFNNRVYGKFDVYQRKVDNLIYSISVPVPPSIHSKTTMNYGNLENKGWEAEIGGEPIKKPNFSISSILRLSKNKSKIISLWGNNTYQDRVSFPAPGTPGTSGRLEEGTQIGSYFIWEHAGVTDEGKWLIYNKDNNVILADNKTYNDKRYIGNAIPKLILAWENNASYKNFHLTILMRSWIKYDVFNTINMYYGLQNVTNQNVLNTAFIKNRNIKDDKLLSNYWLEDGTFLKIDAINLHYQIPLKNKKYIKSLGIYTSIRDLATFSKYTGLNPEVNINGLDPGYEWFNNIYPRTTNYTLGFQIQI